MSVVTRPRGPLPASVYWRRRALVTALAIALVFGIGQLLGGGSDGKSSGDTAQLTGAQQQPGGPVGQQSNRPGTQPTGSATGNPTSQGSKGAQPTKTATPLAQPDGPCSPSEVLVTPRVTGAVAGREVALALALTSTESAACTFRISPDTLAVKLTSGSDFIWSSQQCPRSITTQDVIVRKAQPTQVTLTWSGRRSDQTCSRTTTCWSGSGWCRPGWYHAIAAALGGTATDQQFELNYPARPTVTVTVHPTITASPKGHPAGVSEPSKPD